MDSKENTKEKLSTLRVGFYWLKQSRDKISTNRILHGVLNGVKTVESETSLSPNWRVPVENLDEIYPGIFLGDEVAAKNIGILKEMKITHILNAAYSDRTSFVYVNTSQKYYSDQKFECTFLGVCAVDCMTYKLAKYFQQASEFIDVAVNFPDGKVLVHCRQGVSRSATFVIVYLMLKKGMTAIDAVTLVRNKRNIFPNKGFLKEICDLEQTLLKLRINDNRDYVDNEMDDVTITEIVDDEVNADSVTKLETATTKATEEKKPKKEKKPKIQWKPKSHHSSIQ